MLFDRPKKQLIIQHPGDSLQLIVHLMGNIVLDEETTDKLVDEVTLAEGEGTRDGWTNYDMSMEFYPICLSPESTRLVFEALGIAEENIPDVTNEID